ncbi:MAG: hypothetical protein B7733_16330, partial [Myxococcales bacterium FL481]
MPVAERVVWFLPSLVFGCASPVSPSEPATAPQPTASSAPTETNTPMPPIAAQRPHAVPSPHGARMDPYYWLRDDERKDPDVLAYLNAENAYRDEMLAPLRPLQNDLYDEIVGRIATDDSSV